MGLQEDLDTDKRIDLTGDVTLTRPLWVRDPDHDLLIQGNGYTLTGRLIVGWDRTAVPDGHWTGGFRTKHNDAYAHAVGLGGGLWDTGLTPGGGWPSLTRFRVVVQATMHDGDWQNRTICGINAFEYATHALQPNPSPWVLYTTDTELRLVVRLRDAGVVTFSTTAVDLTQSFLEVYLDLYFETGVTEYIVWTPGGYVNGNMSGTLPVGDRLVENWLWHFAVGRIEHAINTVGSWGGDRYDATFTFVGIYNQDGGMVSSDFSRQAAGEPLLDGGLMAVFGGTPPFYEDAQWVSDMSRVVRVENLLIKPPSTQLPAVLLGSCQHDTTFEYLRVRNASRAITTSSLAVVFPVRVYGGVFEHLSDCAFHFFRASSLSINQVKVAYPGRRIASLWGCAGEVNLPMVTPGGPPAPRQWLVYGHYTAFHHTNSDFEYDTDPPGGIPPVVEFFPLGAEVQTESCGIRLTDSGGGTAAWALLVHPRAAGYTGEVTAIVEQMAPDRMRGVRIAPGAGAVRLVLNGRTVWARCRGRPFEVQNINRW